MKAGAESVMQQAFSMKRSGDYNKNRCFNAVKLFICLKEFSVEMSIPNSVISKYQTFLLVH